MKQILNVKIDDISQEEFLSKATGWLLNNKEKIPKLIATVGPEFLLTAQKDIEFKSILNSTDLSIPDGVGLQIVSGARNRLPGLEMMLELCRIAHNYKLRIGLFGGGEGVAKKTEQKLLEMFPGVLVTFAIDGKEADRIIGHTYSIVDKRLTHQLKCDILFVALGHPKQEMFLWNTRLKILNSQFSTFNFKVGMGVGGAFDELSGHIPLCPAWISSLGLKWLYRILVEPMGTKTKRIKRVFKAVVMFPLAVLKEKLFN